jgi:hypothetical protein
VVGTSYSELTALGLKNGDTIMQNKGQAGAKKSYRVLLLLVVGLAATANAFKELNQLRDLTLQTTHFVAQLQEAFVPAGDLATVRGETCQNRRVLPPPPLPEAPSVPPAPAVESDAVQVEVPAVAPVAPVRPAGPSVVAPAAPKVREVPQARPVRPARAAEVRVFVPAVDFEKSIKEAFQSDQSLKALKAKSRRYLYVTPDGHDVIFKTLNRSINLRSAS